MTKNKLDELRAELGLHDLGVAPAVDEARKMYPWAKAVIVAAISYLPPEVEIGNERLCGWVARFARGADYHDVMREKLGRVADALRLEHPKAKMEICVDTCPLPERKLAVLAGIAWRGKNGNVFVDGCGSYVALGEIVTNLDLPIAEPLSIDRCGDCEQCLRECPTGAITEPYRVDAPRCVSQLTQMSGTIPPELRRAIGGRIYGCDTCQEVCPQNAGIEPKTPEFAVNRSPGLDLPLLIKLDKQTFNKLIRRSPIGWIRRTRIRRNAAVAAGNLKCEEAVPGLLDMLEDENPVLSSHAAWALEEMK
ncbi:MAG: tRNA epoxyqueuosine(34) reductase QueG [Armatimonadetes bacterium]|nr:tRNA epoxyqueuosine(34) reductase QueG [Armatimonadota bacterium]